MKYETFTISELRDKAEANELLLFDGQRNYIYKQKDVALLLDTIFSPYHDIPPIYVWKDENGIMYLMDGQQRLTSIFRVLGWTIPHFDGKTSGVYRPREIIKSKELTTKPELIGLPIDKWEPSVIRYIMEYPIWVATNEAIKNYDDAADWYNRMNTTQKTLTPVEQAKNKYGKKAYEAIKKIVEIDDGEVIPKTSGPRMNSCAYAAALISYSIGPLEGAYGKSITNKENVEHGFEYISNLTEREKNSFVKVFCEKLKIMGSIWKNVPELGGSGAIIFTHRKGFSRIFAMTCLKNEIHKMDYNELYGHIKNKIFYNPDILDVDTKGGDRGAEIVRKRVKELDTIIKNNTRVQAGSARTNIPTDIKDVAYKRAGNKCENCDSPVGLELHHKNGNNSDHRTENIELLCKICHNDKHGYPARQPR